MKTHIFIQMTNNVKHEIETEDEDLINAAHAILENMNIKIFSYGSIEKKEKSIIYLNPNHVIDVKITIAT